MNKPPIADVLTHYGANRVPTGHRWKPMLCVLHDERRPSASVNTEENKFRCFVCDFYGDSFDLIARKERCSDFTCTRECAARIFGAEYGRDDGPDSRGVGASKRRIPFEGQPGQRSIFDSRPSRSLPRRRPMLD